MSVLVQDLRYAFRIFLKRPGFAVVAVFVHARGKGANTAADAVSKPAVKKATKKAAKKESKPAPGKAKK